jgi:hypothetical protein
LGRRRSSEVRGPDFCFRSEENGGIPRMVCRMRTMFHESYS